MGKLDLVLEDTEPEDLYFSFTGREERFKGLIDRLEDYSIDYDPGRPEVYGPGTIEIQNNSGLNGEFEANEREIQEIIEKLDQLFN